MKILKIYLAGAMQGKSFEEMSTWRYDLRNILNQINTYNNLKLNVVNPVNYYNFVEVKYQTQREIMKYDLNHVKSSDLVVVNLDGLNTSIGSIIELYECYTRNIPVIAFGDYQKYDNLHSWIKECITRVDTNIYAVRDYIYEFYMK